MAERELQETKPTVSWIQVTWHFSFIGQDPIEEQSNYQVICWHPFFCHTYDLGLVLGVESDLRKVDESDLHSNWSTTLLDRVAVKMKDAWQWRTTAEGEEEAAQEE